MVGTKYQQAVGAYLQSLAAAGRSPETIASRRSALLRLGFYAKTDKLKSVAKCVPQFLAFQNDRLSHNTAAQMSIRLRRFFLYCVEARLLKHSPFDALPKPRTHIKMVVPLTDLELRRLLDAGDTLDRAIIILLLSTGLRIAELASLRWSDVRGDTLHVTGKGGKDRLVAVGGVAYRLLLSLPHVNDYVIPLSKQTMQIRMASLSRRTGVPCYCHLLRHCCADRLRENGVDVSEISTILGHASLQTTMIYLRGNQQDRALEAQRRFNPADTLLGEGGGKVVAIRG